MIKYSVAPALHITAHAKERPLVEARLPLCYQFKNMNISGDLA